MSGLHESCVADGGGGGEEGRVQGQGVVDRLDELTIPGSWSRCPSSWITWLFSTCHPGQEVVLHVNHGSQGVEGVLA